MADLLLSIDVDPDPQCPMDFDCSWTLHSFSRHSIHENHEFDPDHVDGPLPIGVRRKLQVGTAFWLSEGQEDHYIESADYDKANTPDGILLWERNPKELNKGYQARQQDAE